MDQNLFRVMNKNAFQQQPTTMTIDDGGEEEDLIEITKSELVEKEKPKSNGNLNFNLKNRP
jgi:hypothetical protein